MAKIDLSFKLGVRKQKQTYFLNQVLEDTCAFAYLNKYFI